MARSEAYPKSTWLTTMAALAVVVAAMYLAKPVLVPLTLSVLLSFLLAPICEWLEKWRFGRIPAVITTAVLAFVVIGVVAWVVALQLTELANALPGYRENIEEKVRNVNDYVGSAYKKVSRTTEEIGQELEAAEKEAAENEPPEDRAYPVRIVPAASRPLEMLGSMFGTVFQFLASAGVVAIFVIFFLIRREDLRDRFIRLMGQGQITVTTQALTDAATRLSRYLAMQLLINASYGAPVAIGLYFIGIPNAMLWGVLATVLRFIPYLGPWIAATMPIALSLAVAPGWVKPSLVIGMFLVLELFSNNVMEPWLYGSRTGVSPVAVLVAAVFWTWLWGGVGLLLATPLTVCLLVIGKYVPQLSFFNILLGDQPVFDPPMRLYQRLLAGDQEDAEEMIEELEEEGTSLVQIYDTLLLPALALAERDHHRGDLDDSRHSFIRENIREFVEELGERQAEKDVTAEGDGEPVPKREEANSTAKHRRCIVCLPARDAADEIVCTMFLQVLERNGFTTETVSAKALASEMIDLVDSRAGDVVCISAVPPAAAIQARYLCKRLISRHPNLSILVGLWTVKDLIKAQSRIGCGRSVTVVASLSAGLNQLRKMVEPDSIRIDRRGDAVPPAVAAATPSHRP